MEAEENVFVGLAEFATPTILFLGDAVSFLKMVTWLETGVRAPLPTRELFHSVNLKLKLSLDANVTAVSLTNDGNFSWAISAADGRKYSQLIRAMIESNIPSHVYLDVMDSAGLEIIASIGEYEIDVFRN